MVGCSFLALLSSLLGLAGLAGLGHYYRHGHLGHGHHGHHEHDEHHGHHGHHGHFEMQKRCDEGFKIIKCHRQCGEDMECHDSCPLPECPKMAQKVKGIIQCNVDCGSDFACRQSCNRPVMKFVEMCSKKPQGPKGPHFELQPPRAQFIVSKFRMCQKECKGDQECLEKCPKPFWMGFKRTCQEAIPIMECHKACGHDHQCHVQCPMPSCPHMKGQMEKTLKCHAACGDRECHHLCPKPMKHILTKCGKFEEAQGCHQKCNDFKCHHECPKARLWKFFKHSRDHFGFHGEHHHFGFHGERHHFGFHGEHHEHHRFHGEHHEHHRFHGEHHEHRGFHGEHHEHHRSHGSHNHHYATFGAVPEPAPVATIALRGSIPEEKLIDCQSKCQNDEQCLEKCAAVWEELQKDCFEVAEIMGCHEKCHDFMCHKKCPLPSMPWLKAKVEASTACHQKCPGDMSCHQKCPCPFAEMKEKCGTLGPRPGTWKISKPTEVTV